MEAYIQVVTTTEKRQDAEKIAKALVERRLAACAQIVGPIVSTYWWKDNIETAEEWQCLIKSKKSFYSEVEKAIKVLHPYETPEKPEVHLHTDKESVEVSTDKIIKTLELLGHIPAIEGSTDYTAEEEDAIKNRLQDLGYI